MSSETRALLNQPAALVLVGGSNEPRQQLSSEKQPLQPSQKAECADLGVVLPWLVEAPLQELIKLAPAFLLVVQPAQQTHSLSLWGVQRSPVSTSCRRISLHVTDSVSLPPCSLRTDVSAAYHQSPAEIATQLGAQCQACAGSRLPGFCARRQLEHAGAQSCSIKCRQQPVGGTQATVQYLQVRLRPM